MHESVFFDQRLLASDEAKLRAISSAAFYGRGIFTTIAIHRGVPFLWEKHFRRLQTDGGKLGIDLSDLSEESISAALAEILAVNSVREGRARITIFDESSGDLWRSHAPEQGTNLLITTAEPRTAPVHPSLGISRYRLNSSSPLAGVKSCNYLEKIIAIDEAKCNGFDEAVQLNERGEVTSACMANVFWTKSGKLFTPSLGTGCIAGTTREYVLENLECEEIESNGEVLDAADEIFLTSAGIGVVQAAEFNGRELRGEKHAISSLLPPIE